MRETLRELGLLDLPSDLNLDCLSPLMHQDIATRVMDDWHKSLLSSDSFYTNKHGKDANIIRLICDMKQTQGTNWFLIKVLTLSKCFNWKIVFLAYLSISKKKKNYFG